MGFISLACAAILIEACFGYPQVLFRMIGHPVTWMGAWLAVLERGLNRPAWSFGCRRAAGVGALAALLAATFLMTLPFELAAHHRAGFLIAAIAAASLPAQRSLFTHVAAVADALEEGGLEEGRTAVAMIVGRNPAYLDEAAVARAAIESLAENFADGVVAPALWIALGGLPAGALYKAVNTADSMIGHKSERYLAFGWSAARLDDLVNLPASRLAAVWLVAAAQLTGHDARITSKTIRRDASRHRSPNAGWPEAAMAGSLGLQLNGPRVYGDKLVEDAYMGQGRRDATPADIRRALGLYRTACAIQVAALSTLTSLAWLI